jgi:hypothetical protein
MRKIITLFLTTVIIFIGIPGFSSIPPVARAATSSPPDVPESVCEKLEKALDSAQDLSKALQQVASYLQNSAAKTGAGSSAGRNFGDLFKNASSKLDAFLKNYGVEVTDFTSTVTWGPMSMARKLALLRATNPTLTPLLLETIEAFIQDYILQGYPQEDAEALAEGVLDAVDNALGALPLGTKLVVDLLKGLIELIQECRKQREGRREVKPRDTVGDRGHGDKQGKLGPPNDNHGDPRTNVTVSCLVYGPIGVYEDGTVIYGYYWIPC